MRASYRGVVTLVRLLAIPAGTPVGLRRKWKAQIKRWLESDAATARQRAHVKSLLLRVKKIEGKKLYAEGMRTNAGVPARRGVPFKGVIPFGKWYIKP
jgi:hypothetical protein